MAISDKIRPSAPIPVCARHSVGDRGTIRGVPSSIKKGEVDRNRNGTAM